MQKTIAIILSLSLSSAVLIANDTDIREDREKSFRKAIDIFGKIDEKDVSTVDKFKQMFSDGKVSGQIRSVFAGYKQKAVGKVDIYATALGGTLKYELASLHGFNAGFAFTTSQDLGFATGDTGSSKQNDELSSPSGGYSALSEAYVNYKNGDLNIRLGRQMIDTPLADTDDIRMVANTFEAYMLTYEFNKVIFTLGNVQQWQGTGAGLGYINGVRQDTNWIDTEGRGTSMVGLSYEQNVELNAWHYDIQKQDSASQASYFDLGYHWENDSVSVHGYVQYLHESEMKNSGVDADIHGVLFEVFLDNMGINVAYNKAKRHQGKKSYSGIGGSSLYTNMDTMILDEIADDREASSIVLGLDYSIDNFTFLYAYGDFVGEENIDRKKEHIVEQNLAVEYKVNDEFMLMAIYVKEEDKESATNTTYDWDRLQVMIEYNF